MSESEQLRSKLVKVFKACKGDDELQTHLKARLADGYIPSFPALTYDRLQHAQKFRLLTLLPGHLNAGLRCTLETFDLNKPPQYRALSYVWGDQNQTLPIECNQQTAWITTNLYSALIRIRLPDQGQTLWVDALCIDQATDQHALRERAEQVRRMDQVFSKADEVIIDLGGATRRDTTCFMQGYHYFLKWTLEQDIHSAPYGPDHPFWPIWLRLYLKPWFSRVWIVQEWVLAQKAVMLLGTAKIDPYKIHDLGMEVTMLMGSMFVNDLSAVKRGSFVQEYAKNGKLDLRTKRNYGAMLDYHRLYKQSGRKQSLLALLDMSRYMRATDIRDHVYALAGLVEDWDRLNIPIDYTQNELATRLSVGRALVSTDRVWYCLSRASGIDSSVMTWMPLLSDNRWLDLDLDRSFMGLCHIPYGAAGDTTCVASVSDVHTFLVITGFRVDTIKSIAPILTHRPGQLGTHEPWPDAVTKIFEYYSRLISWSSQMFPECSSIDVKHSLWRAMSLDVVDGEDYYFRSKIRASLPILADQFEMLEDHHELNFKDNASIAKLNFNSFTKTKGGVVRDILEKPDERKICATGQGRIGNVPSKAVHGNEIWIIFGLPFPMVLRHLGGAYAVVGPAYVQGLMDGEALELAERQDETIYLA